MERAELGGFGGEVGWEPDRVEMTCVLNFDFVKAPLPESLVEVAVFIVIERCERPVGLRVVEVEKDVDLPRRDTLLANLIKQHQAATLLESNAVLSQFVFNQDPAIDFFGFGLHKSVAQRLRQLEIPAEFFGQGAAGEQVL